MARASLLQPAAKLGLPLAAALVLLALVTPGCFGRECEPTFLDFGDKPGEGDFIDADTWESTTLDAPWLDFPAQRTYRFIIPQFTREGRQTYFQEALVSPSPIPNQDNCNKETPPVCNAPDNWTVGTGNIALFFLARNGYVNVKNDTCAHFYVRVILRAKPLPPAPPETLDASADGASDGSSDAKVDATD